MKEEVGKERNHVERIEYSHMYGDVACIRNVVQRDL